MYEIESDSHLSTGKCATLNLKDLRNLDVYYRTHKKLCFIKLRVTFTPA